MRTIRVRLALTTSSWLFAISALLLVAVYLALSQTIDARPLDPVTVKKFERRPDGTMVYKAGETFQAADLETVQRAVNQSTLDTLRNYSLLALIAIFAITLLVGWFVAGRLLRPIGEITHTANRLRATDLSQRINATGPRDELRMLADTLDDMLERLDTAFRAERALVEDVSHELRNPVAVIQANVEAVLADPRATSEERAHALTVVGRATVPHVATVGGPARDGAPTIRFIRRSECGSERSSSTTWWTSIASLPRTVLCRSPPGSRKARWSTPIPNRSAVRWRTCCPTRFGSPRP